jgi:hypothetical protein
MCLSNRKGQKRKSFKSITGCVTVKTHFKAIRQGKRKKEICIICTFIFEKSWTFLEHYPNCNVTRYDIEGKKGLMDLLKRLFKENKKFDAIVLAPDHGIDGLPLSRWKDNEDTPNGLEMTAAFKVTQNVHYCTCSRGIYVEDILRKMKFRKKDKNKRFYVSGYMRDINGFEIDTLDYITTGCLTTPSRIKSKHLRIFNRIV